jgi:hypothetical protein
MTFMITVDMQQSIAVGISSLPKEIMSKMDSERGDVPRSRYLLRILEKLYLGKKSVKNSNQDPLDRGFASLQSSESEGP